MNNYIVRLTPIDSYFFGGEVTFGEGTNQNYLVESNLLPQVSTVLGVMRYVILRQENLLAAKSQDDFERVKSLIGEKGFCMDPKVTNYGVIKQISPVFVENYADHKYYMPMPLDFGYDVRSDEDFEFLTEAFAYKKKGIEIEKFDCKNYDNYQYWIDNSGKEKLKESAIFKEVTQVGITKNNRRDDENDAFLKQKSYRMAYGFCFTLSVSLDYDLDVSDSFVFMGGNRSMFRMQIEKKNYDFKTTFSALKKDGRKLLLGDAFFTDKERESMPFCWGCAVANRYIITNYSSSKKWDKPVKTEKLFKLLKRGGVVLADCEDEIPAKEYLTNVGLNIFI